MAAFQKSVPVEDFDKILTIAEVAAELLLEGSCL